MTEAKIQDGFAAWLRARNIPFIMPRRDKRSTIAAGAQDCTAFLPGGKLLCIEMKTEKGKRSDEQTEWAERMAAVGHHVHLCRSIAECIAVAERFAPSCRLVIFGEGIFKVEGSELTYQRKAKPGDERIYERLSTADTAR